MKRVGIFVHSRSAAARQVAGDVAAYLEGRVSEIWQTSDWEDPKMLEEVPGTELLVCLGGDGTMLHAARSVVPYGVPVLGVNMGRLGFLAEVRPGEAIDRLRDAMEGRCRIEERTMLQGQVPSWGVTFHGLNDVVVGRANVARPVDIDVSVDGMRLAVHRCDAIIVSSATGSTAYSLSAGGPILHPESCDIVLTPVAPHMAAARPMVFPPETVIDLVVGADKDAIVSVDGQVDRSLENGALVTVCRSPHVARFVRFRTSHEYWSTLAERLDWLRDLRASGHSDLFDQNGIPVAK